MKDLMFLESTYFIYSFIHSFIKQNPKRMFAKETNITRQDQNPN